MHQRAAFYEGNKAFRVGQHEVMPPGPGETTLKVAYCGICGTDVHIYHGQMDGRVQIPQVIGHEVSAEVAEIGPGVENVSVGDRVAVRPLKPGEPAAIDNGCTHIGQNLKFLGIDTPGAMQQFWTVPASTLHRLPDSCSFEHGALIEPVAVACHDVRLGAVRPDEFAVVIGGGPIGLLVAMVAREKGAKVLVSEVSQQRLELIRDLGFVAVNPQTEDIKSAVAAFTGGAFADVVFEVSGTAVGVATMTELARVRGRIVLVAIHSSPRPIDLFRFFWRELRLQGVRVYEPEDFEEAISLVSQGGLAVDRLITQISPLDDVQHLFEAIDRNPAGMKYLIQCND